jgi:hypothetical protein
MIIDGWGSWPLFLLLLVLIRLIVVWHELTSSLILIIIREREDSDIRDYMNLILFLMENHFYILFVWVMFPLCFDRSRRRVGFGSQLELWQILFLQRFSSSFISDFHLLPWACTPSQSRFPIRFYSSHDRIPRPGFISALRSILSLGADLGPCSNPRSLLLANSEERILLYSDPLLPATMSRSTRLFSSPVARHQDQVQLGRCCCFVLRRRILSSSCLVSACVGSVADSVFPFMFHAQDPAWPPSVLFICFCMPQHLSSLVISLPPDPAAPIFAIVCSGFYCSRFITAVEAARLCPICFSS